ncbi:hypothetical protein A8W25_06060 [Streptomyces sp. ERV7]|uniref:hypothetical protein n=1 Tax=Streptomyces sp. ERV7 TaxID=1322334 RepID=UPI0007F4F8D7|nr:hypothetical protein [Streptomyces sp. ERV7]OAR25213.1 hypothetical protein A8W25_06060 [Streptomyces sp. ERV7]
MQAKGQEGSSACAEAEAEADAETATDTAVDTEADAAPDTAVPETALTAAVHAEALLRDGRLAEAREAARRALDTHEPVARLYTVLGRAHAAENDDDHDDRAETVYRTGLDAFPNDIELLSAYAELCLNADYLERPGRHRRGPELTARIRELAPGSTQALRAERAAGGKNVPKPARVQRHDARLVLTLSPTPRTAADRARIQAAARPEDERLAVLAETLSTLVRPGRGPLRWMVGHPLATTLLSWVSYAAVLLAVPAVPLPAWTACAAALPLLPSAVLHQVLRGARRRAQTHTPPTPTQAPQDLTFPVLPPVPAHTTRGRVAGALVLATAVGAAAGSVTWSQIQYRDYPRYTVAAPLSLGVLDRLELTPAQQGMADQLNVNFGGTAHETFAYVYGDEELGRTAFAVFGATGDFHQMTPDLLDELREGLEASGLTVSAEWNAEPGHYGGWMKCVTYKPAASVPEVACGWADKGSIGIVITAERSTGRNAAEETTRRAREAVLHRGTGAERSEPEV